MGWLDFLQDSSTGLTRPMRGHGYRVNGPGVGLGVFGDVFGGLGDMFNPSGFRDAWDSYRPSGGIDPSGGIGALRGLAYQNVANRRARAGTGIDSTLRFHTPPAPPNIDLRRLMEDAQVGAIVKSMIGAQNRPLAAQSRQVRRDASSQVRQQGQLNREFQHAHGNIVRGADRSEAAYAKRTKALRDEGQKRMKDNAAELDGLSSSNYNDQTATDMKRSAAESRERVQSNAEAHAAYGMDTGQAATDTLRTMGAAAGMEALDNQESILEAARRAREAIYAQIAANRARAGELRLGVAGQVGQSMQADYQNRVGHTNSLNESLLLGHKLRNDEEDRAFDRTFKSFQMQQAMASPASSAKPMTRSALRSDLKNFLYHGTMRVPGAGRSSSQKPMVRPEYGDMSPDQLMNEYMANLGGAADPQSVIAAFKAEKPAWFRGHIVKWNGSEFVVKSRRRKKK